VLKHKKNKPKEESQEMDNRRPGDWDCPQCNQMNFASRVKCFKCGVQKQDGGGGGGGAPVLGVGGQPYQYVMPHGQYPTYNQKQGGYGYYNKNKNVKEGDWFCACGAHNYAFRTDCFRCKNVKPEGQVQVPPGTQYGGGQPQIKPGDWYCPGEGCGFHNFANRDKCFKCGTQKAVAAGFQ